MHDFFRTLTKMALESLSQILLKDIPESLHRMIRFLIGKIVRHKQKKLCKNSWTVLWYFWTSNYVNRNSIQADCRNDPWKITWRRKQKRQRLHRSILSLSSRVLSQLGRLSRILDRRSVIDPNEKFGNLLEYFANSKTITG